MSDWINSVAECSSSSNSISIAEMVAQTASQVMTEQILPGYIYYEDYGAYYNHETGYFYDLNTSLFYHPMTQSYYHFDEVTNQYEHCTVEENKQSPKWTSSSFHRRANKLFGPEFVQNASQDQVDVTELTLDLVDRCSFLAGDHIGRRLRKRAHFEDQMAEEQINGISLKPSNNANNNWPTDDGLSFSSESDNDEFDKTMCHMEGEIARRLAEEEMAQNAPCIRLVEQPANCLHIITILGACLCVNKTSKSIMLHMGTVMEHEANEDGALLLRIGYSSPDYFLEMTAGNVNVTINGHLIDNNVQYLISHGDLIQIAEEISLSFHIHQGLNTCQFCEPGLFPVETIVDAKSKKRISCNKMRRLQMRAIKNAYGLLDEDLDANSKMSGNYLDRARKRRKEDKISGEELATDIYASCQARRVPGGSIHSVQLRSETVGKIDAQQSSNIEGSNKGFKLLERMGWTAGQGLGKDNQGIQNPLLPTLKTNRTGLGMDLKTSKSNGATGVSERQRILQITKQRYEEMNDSDEANKLNGEQNDQQSAASKDCC